MAPQPFHLDTGDGRRFCLYHAPAAGRGLAAAVVYVHPFAEEMNKSRPMAALQARALAAAGCAVLQIDLGGCGDSPGGFGDATWEGWVADVVAAAAWLRARSGHPLWLWGLRAGCLVAAAAAARLPEPANFLFWQPVLSGKQHLHQFLRLRLAEAMMDGDPREAMADLRRRLERQETVEIAGYDLGPALAAGLAAAELAPPAGGGRVAWLETASGPDPALPAASAGSAQAWRQAGFGVRTRLVAGPAFWHTVDIAEAPALVDASLEALAEEGG